jgi:hypothetical protein
MQRTRALVCFIVVALVLGSAGCTGSGGSTSGGRALDTSKAVELAIGSARLTVTCLTTVSLPESVA